MISKIIGWIGIIIIALGIIALITTIQLDKYNCSFIVLYVVNIIIAICVYGIARLFVFLIELTI